MGYFESSPLLLVPYVALTMAGYDIVKLVLRQVVDRYRRPHAWQSGAGGRG